MGPPVPHRVGAEDRHQRSARGAAGRPEATALHRDGGAARLSLHRCRDRNRDARRRNPGRPEPGGCAMACLVIDRPRRCARAPGHGMAARGRRQAPDRMDRRRSGRGEDHADRTFHGRSGRRPLRARAMRRAVRRRRALSARSGSAHGIVPARYGAGGADPRRRSDMAAATAVAEQCSRARGSAPRAHRHGPGAHVAGNGRAAGSLHGGSSAAARHRGPALERSSDGAAHRLRRAPSHRHSTAVARELPPFGNHRRGSSARGRAPGASSSPAMRRDRARRVLRKGSRRVSRRARSRARGGRDIRARAACIAPTGCRFSSPMW